MGKSTKYVALDVHKDSITVAVASKGQKMPRHYGAIAGTEDALGKLCGNLAGPETSLRFCYEAGPCGYGVYRQLRGLGHECVVVAPSLIPRRPGDHVKTDRRDALSLARLFKNGELTSVWVPDEAQGRIKGLDQALLHTLEEWSREDETRGLMALRGVNTLTAITTLAELGGSHSL